MSPISDGQAVNAAVTNAAFLYKDTDDTSSGTLTLGGVILPAFTASRALVSSASKGIASSATTTTQLEYLSIATGTTGTGNLAYSIAPAFTGNATFDTTTLTIDATNDRVGVGTSSPSFSFDVQKSAASANQAIRIYNTDNTSGTSHATLEIRVGGTSGGDARVHFDNNTADEWTMGLDNSDSDAFVLAKSSALGTGNAFRMSTAGDASLPLGSLSFGTSGKGIVGTTTNDTAAAGVVGEPGRVTASSVSFAATGTWGDITSFSLTAGDWDIAGCYLFRLNGATMTSLEWGISTTSGNSATGLTKGDNWFEGVPPTAASDVPGFVTAWRLSIASTTTVYLKTKGSFTVATPLVLNARMSARRVR